MRYSVGLDIGIASVGWAAMLLDEQDEPCRILDMGSRVFVAAEESKTGNSLAQSRRENRSARRRLRRCCHRKERLTYLLENENIITAVELDKLYAKPSFKRDIYEIRAVALDEQLDKEAFVRLLVHLAQRRGFKSNRKADAKDTSTDDGKLIAAVKANANLMVDCQYRTIGEMLFKDPKFAETKRNKSGDYSNTFGRDALEQEIKLIFAAQRKYDSPFATEQLEEHYLKIYLSQRSFEDGPAQGPLDAKGKGSPYFGNQIEKMMRHCTFEPTELRASKGQYSFEYFTLLQKINSIRIITGAGRVPLTEEQRGIIIVLAKTKADINYVTIRKTLKLSEDKLFNITYGEKTAADTEKKTKFNYMKNYHLIKKAFGDSHKYLSPKQLNLIGYALSVYKEDKKMAAYLVECGFSQHDIDLAMTVPNLSGTGNLSVVACEKMIPYLEKGMVYSEACFAAGYNFKNDTEIPKSLYLPANEKDAPELLDIVNPVVRRAVSQTIKVINAIIRNYGCSPCFIKVELARELAKDFDERKKIEKEQKNNFTKNQQIIDSIKKYDNIQNPTGQDLLKLKLWQEQDGICPYSLQHIKRERLFEVGYVDIDHIIPYSICFDDSYKNKVLVFTEENRQKGNRLPMQYVSDKDKFAVWVTNSVHDQYKRAKLLKASYTEEDEKAWKERNLTDTKYISRFMYNYIKRYLLMEPNKTGFKQTVVAVNGGATAYMRKRWGINKVREDGDLHHAVDAVVIACITIGMLQRIERYSKRKELEYSDIRDYDAIDTNTGELINHFPMPYPHLRDELLIRLSNDPTARLTEKMLLNYKNGEVLKPIFVSQMPRRKVTGSAHKETVRSAKAVHDGLKISKVALTALKLDQMGDIANYYMPDSDRLLYEALKKQLQLYNGNGAKAFEQFTPQNPFRKPKSDGTDGPSVNKVKILEPTTLNVAVGQNTAIADNGSMVRVDVFNIAGEGYFLVPIYVSDTVKKQLPNRAITRGKLYSEWKEMEDKDFVFSVYPSDLLHATLLNDAKFVNSNKDSTLPKEMYSKDFFAYYVSTGISTNSIHIVNHDRTYEINSFGVKTLPLLQKCQVDVLGNITVVGKETRMGFR